MIMKTTDVKTIHVLSLGAGVQSSTLAFMYAAGLLSPMPVAAVFADTHGEPKTVYDYLEHVEKSVPFPVLRVSAGDLIEDFKKVISGQKKRCGQPPFYVKKSPDDRGGMLWRQCTKDYKLNPIARAVRQLAKDYKAKHVVQIVGISWDEMTRMKESGRKYVTNIHPLVDMRWTRQMCLAWLKEQGHPEPPKSACWYCPYTSNARWAEMRDNQSESWKKAVQLDRQLRTGKIMKNIVGAMYLHRSFTPLEEARLTDSDHGQEVMSFQDECDGICNV